MSQPAGRSRAVVWVLVGSWSGMSEQEALKNWEGIMVPCFRVARGMPEFQFPEPTTRKIGPFMRKLVIFAISCLLFVCFLNSNTLFRFYRIICRPKRGITHSSYVVRFGGLVDMQQCSNCLFLFKMVLQYMSYFGMNHIRRYLMRLRRISFWHHFRRARS